MLKYCYRCKVHFDPDQDGCNCQTLNYDEIPDYYNEDAEWDDGVDR